jgi:catechol 2,3-dioxygenase
MDTQKQTTSAAFSIHPATLIGHVSLNVADLERQLAFYQQILGLRVHWRKAGRAGLGAGGDDFLRLVETPAYQRYRQTTGLYHFAILVPDRHALAVAVARLFQLRYRNYPTDHIMTKTTYLDDPEGNGIELYSESPEDGSWSMQDGAFVTLRADGSLSDGREPLHLEGLFSHLKEGEPLDAPMPSETRMGHIHLHVGNLERAVDFYHGVLGFDVMGLARSWGAAFVSAGGYHHHVGLNTWRGEGAPPPPADALGLRYFTVELKDKAALDQVLERVRQAGVPTEENEAGIRVRDPFENGIVLVSRSA